MLCSSKTNHRPDKLLQRRLIALAYSLLALTGGLIAFMVHPGYFLYLIPTIVVIVSFCLILTIKTLNAAEEAISYGGFANEIIRNDFKIKRIDNAGGEAVIQNDPAKELFKNLAVLPFIEQHLADNRQNKTAFYRLQTAITNLVSEKVTLSLVLRQETGKIFNDEEWFEISVRPIFLKKADIFEGAFSIKAIKKDTYLFWSINNITAAKNMEQIFQLERKSLHDFLDYLPVGLYTSDKNYMLEYTNHAFANFTGRNRESLNGISLQSLLSSHSELPLCGESWKGKLHFENQNHEINEVLVFQESFRENNQLKIRGVVVNGLPSENDLRHSLSQAFDKISWLFNFAPVGIIFTTPEGIINDCNEAARAFLDPEMPPEKIRDRCFFDYIRSDAATSLQKEFADISAKKQASSSIDIRFKQDKGERTALLYTSPTRKYYGSEVEQISGLVLYLVDATKQKKLEQQFVQAQKNQALGQLAGGVAHDFNNLLTALIGYCDLLLQRHGVGDPSFADLIQIKQNANRAAGLVKQILAYARQQPIKPEILDITENFAELSNLLKRTIGEQIKLKFHHGRDLGLVNIDPTQFTQIILNLAINAKDAMNGSGTLEITTRVENISEDFHFGADLITAGDFVAIDVKDSGCGIPPENLNHIFEPFFSTKKNIVGSGTGLGLSQVYGIMRQNNGFIKVDSTVGQGTTFSLYFPRLDKSLETEEESRSTAQDIITTEDGTPVLTVQERIKSPISVNEKLILGLNLSTFNREYETLNQDAANIRILFVDDEDSLRTFALRALKKKGYDVTGCNSAENALDYLEQDQKFDLMITDMVMPGMNGAELATLVRQKHPEMKIILASGYSEEIVKQEVENFDEFEFLTKPFSLSDLTAKVFDVLNEK